MKNRAFYSGLIRLLILHYAQKSPIYGLWVREELEALGIQISTGTLYPLLHELERKGYLLSHAEHSSKNAHRLYHTTEKGVDALADAKITVNKLIEVLFEER